MDGVVKKKVSCCAIMNWNMVKLAKIAAYHFIIPLNGNGGSKGVTCYLFIE